jgi:hypothetical protein
MPDEDIDWSLTTFEGVELRQMREFYALPFREKIKAIEEMNEVAERLRLRQPAKQVPSRPAGDGAATS